MVNFAVGRIYVDPSGFCISKEKWDGKDISKKVMANIYLMMIGKHFTSPKVTSSLLQESSC
jgi:hypothetical protein